MARHKLTDGEKKPKIGITLNKELDDILSDYLEKNSINRSKYIENLIKKDLENKGIDFEPDFNKNKI